MKEIFSLALVEASLLVLLYCCIISLWFYELLYYMHGVICYGKPYWLEYDLGHNLIMLICRPSYQFSLKLNAIIKAFFCGNILYANSIFYSILIITHVHDILEVDPRTE